MRKLLLIHGLPSIRAKAPVKYAEVAGVVTVGPEGAKRMSKVLGREVKVGEQFDLGTLAVYHKNPVRRLWGSLMVAAAWSKNPYAKLAKRKDLLK